MMAIFKSNSCLDGSESRAFQIQMTEVLGSILTGARFCCWILLFSRSKAPDATFAIYANFVVCEKLDEIILCERFFVTNYAYPWKKSHSRSECDFSQC